MKARITCLTLLVALLLLAAPTTRAAAPDAGGNCSPGAVLQGDCGLQDLLSSLVQALLGPGAVRGESTSDSTEPDGPPELGPGMNPDGSTSEGEPGTDPHGGTTELRPDMDPAG